MDAVPRDYSWTRFRSTLEADWAATLSSLGIRWEYEPQTITLPSGTTYVPDFWLPELGTWIEVKGEGVPRTEKAVELAHDRLCSCSGTCECTWPGGEIVIIGQASPPRPAPKEAGAGPPQHSPRASEAGAAGRAGPTGPPGGAEEQDRPPPCAFKPDTAGTTCANCGLPAANNRHRGGDSP